MIRLSKKIASLRESITLGLNERTKQMARQGIKVIDLSVGEPDFDTPALIKAYAIKALRKGFTKYTPTAGIPELKQAIIRKLKSDNGLVYTPPEIVVSCGAKHSIFNAIYALCNPGDEVMIPVPYWVSYPDQVKACGARGVFINAEANGSLKVNLNELARKITKRTKVLILNSPNNPSGVVYQENELKAIARLAIKHQFFIISDEIYEELVYPPAKHISIASLNSKVKELTIVINGVSKAYAMTGWRIGYAAGPQPVMKAIARFQGHLTSNPNSIAQYASVAALQYGAPDCKKMVRAFSQRRQYIISRLQQMPYLQCHKPQGAFYVFPNISRLINKAYQGRKIKDSYSLCELLLTEARISVVPGEGFGLKNYIRISYANSSANLCQGMNRLTRFLTEVR
jgi:aspartate aminotransferase